MESLFDIKAIPNPSQATANEDSSHDSSYLSYTDTSFSIKEGPIAPTFPFTLASSFKRGTDPYPDHILLTPGDNTIRLDTKLNFAEVLQFINSRISIRKQKYVQQIAVDFTYCREIKRPEFRFMIAGLAKSFPALKYLHLNFEKSSCHENCRKLKDEDLIWFSSHITRLMPNLKRFFLQFHQNDYITPNAVKIFCKQIGKRLKRLECLTLDFSRCSRITDQALRPLTHFTTGYLRNLKDFRIIASRVSDGGMRKMNFNKTRYLKQIESLELCIDTREDGLFSRTTQEFNLSKRKFQTDSRQLILYFVPLKEYSFGGKGIDTLSSNFLPYLQNLKALNLHCESLNVRLQSSQNFVKAVNTRINTLEHLRIYFKMCVHLIGDFLDLFQCPENNRLNKLEMQFISIDAEREQNFIPLKPLSSFISNSMQYLKNLTYLDLRFETVYIKDQQTKDLASCIALNLPKLEFLYVNFFWCSSITGETVTAFEESLCAENAIPNVKTLILTFSSCPQIAKKQVKALENSLKSQKPNIESINVYFVDYSTDSNWASDEEEERSDDDDSDYYPDEDNEDDDDDSDYEDITDEDD